MISAPAGGDTSRRVSVSVVSLLSVTHLFVRMFCGTIFTGKGPELEFRLSKTNRLSNRILNFLNTILTSSYQETS